MRNKVLDIAMQDRRIAVVNVHLDGESERIDLLMLKKQGDQVKVAKIHNELDGIEHAIKKGGKRVAYHLHFTGKGVLQKETAWRENYRASLVLNSSVDDLVFTDLIQGEKVFSSIIRRSIVQPFIDTCKDKGCQVTQVTSGEATGAIAAGLLEMDRIHSGNKTLELHNGELRRLQPSETNYVREVDLDGEKVPSLLVPAHSAGIDHLMGLGMVQDSGIDLSGEREEQAQKNLFHTAAGAIAAVFLVLLVGNFLWLDKLQDRLAKVSYELEGANERLVELRSLKDELDAKEALLGSSGMKRNDRIPQLLDDIGHAVPEGLRLTEVEVHPLERKMEDDTPPRMDFSKVEVKGTCDDTEVLNQWMDNVKKLDWVGLAEITSHAINRDGIYEFTVELGIR